MIIHMDTASDVAYDRHVVRGFASLFLATVLVAMTATATSAATQNGPGMDEPTSAPFAEGHINVKFGRDVLTPSARNAFAAGAGLTETGVVEGTGWTTFEIRDGMGTVAKLNQVRQMSGVLQASLDYELEWAAFPQDAPSDPLWDDQWGARKINLRTAWERAGGGSGNHMLAVLDTGVMGGMTASGNWTNQHPDLGFIDGRNFDLPYVNGEPQRIKFNDACGHGTLVAGVAAAFANNGRGIAGVAYNAPIWALRVNGDGCSNPKIGAAAKAITWAANNGAYAIIASWSKDIPNDSDAQILKDAVDYAYSRNVPVVAASGNDDESSFENRVPARWSTVITVGGTDEDNARCRWPGPYFGDQYGANYGSPGLDISAPCLHVLSTSDGGGYDYYDGTSLAVPYVGGVVFLMKSKYPSWTSSQIKNRLWNTARKVGPYGYSWRDDCGGQSKQLGCGLLDAGAAVN